MDSNPDLIALAGAAKSMETSMLPISLILLIADENPCFILLPNAATDSIPLRNVGNASPIDPTNALNFNLSFKDGLAAFV